MFMQEATMIETMNSEQKKKPPYPITHPKYAGNALYTRSLLCRLECAKQVSFLYIRLYLTPRGAYHLAVFRLPIVKGHFSGESPEWRLISFYHAIY